MLPIDILFYSLSILSIVAAIGITVYIFVIVGLLFVLKEILVKVKETMNMASLFEKRAKTGFMYVLLRILDFFGERR